MDIDRAKEIISALAEGIDPTTGELLPEDSVYNKGDIVRALYTVLTSLDAKKPKKNLPENAGKRWTEQDDKKLCEMFDAGVSKKDICNTFKRTSTGIASRLVRLGKIKERDEFRNRKYGMTVSKYLRQLAVADEKAGLLEGPAFRFAQKEEGVIK